MYRYGFVVVLSALATGCGMDSMVLEHQSTLQTAARGVAFPSADAWGDPVARVGMAGSTCDVDPLFASVGSDYDYPTDDETVEDAGTTPDGKDVIVVSTDDSVHVEHDDGWGVESTDYAVDDVIDASVVEADAAVIEADVAVLHGDEQACGVAFPGVEGTADVALPSEYCAGAETITVDPSLGMAYVGSDAGVVGVTPDQDITVIGEEPSQLVAFDDVTGLLYTAEYRAPWVRGVDDAGGVVWEVDLEADVLSLDAMGSRGAAVASVEYGDGSGGMVVIDGTTGEIASGADTPTAADQIVASPDGRFVAVTDGGQVGFYKATTLLEALAEESAESADDEWGDDWSTGDPGF